MKGGGTILGSLWIARVKNLEPGDNIRCLNFAGGEDDLWMGGEVLVVLWAEATGLRDGFWNVGVMSRDCNSETRTLAIRPGDSVCVVSREVAQEARIPKQSSTKTKKPKKGEQLKLF